MDDDMSTPKAAVEPKPGRRRLLKVLAGAGGVFATGALLPERWTRPVVESILVPAHAQATGVLARSYAGGPASASPPGPAKRGLGRQILNTIIPAASANGGNQVSVCLTPGNDTVSIKILDCWEYGDEGTVQLGVDGSFGGPIPPSWTVSGQLGPASGTVTVIFVGGKGGTYIVPLSANAPCVPPLCNEINPNAMPYLTEIFTDTA